jgi:uncharacterized membrane protein YjjP (DUF1212 family)
MAKQASFAQKRRFIIQLGKALHKFGTPAYRLEIHLQNVAEFLGLKAQFIITPTALTFVLIDEETQQEHNYMIRVMPGDIDLGSLARTDELVDEVSSGTRTLDEAIERLDEIYNKPAPYGRVLTFIAFGGSSAGFAMLMQSSWHDVFWSTILGFVVYLFVLWAENSRRVTEMLEPLSAFSCAFLASAISIFDPVINVPIVILSSIIAFIPGLSLTVGLSELAARHLIAGTARIMDAVMMLFKLYFGAVLGVAIGEKLFGQSAIILAQSSTPYISWLAVTLLSISLVILFKSRKKDAPWGILAGYIAYAAALWGGMQLGDALGAFVGAFALGVYSNLFSHFMNLPGSIVRLLGLVVLVPGSKVYIGLNSLVSGNNMVQVDNIGSQAFLIFMSLVAGLIFSNVIMPPRKLL